MFVVASEEVFVALQIESVAIAGRLVVGDCLNELSSERQSIAVAGAADVADDDDKLQLKDVHVYHV